MEAATDRGPDRMNAPVPMRAASPAQAAGGGRHNEGHGRRLTAAFEALESFPVLAESRTRLLRVVGAERVSTGEMVAAVESDVALIISVLRLANQVEGRSRGRVESIVKAVEILSPEAVQALATRARTFDFFERTTTWDAAPERFRLHGVATQRAADRLATETGYDSRDRLIVTALLHDIGKLVLMHAYPGYPGQVHGNARTPDERIHRERRELGVDHALVGGVLARRWGLPKYVASAIERHHADDAVDEAAFVRLRDMLEHPGPGSCPVLRSSCDPRTGRLAGQRCHTIDAADALDHDQEPLRAARPGRARALGRGPGPHRRAGPPPRDPGAVPRAALRRP